MSAGAWGGQKWPFNSMTLKLQAVVRWLRRILGIEFEFYKENVVHFHNGVLVSVKTMTS